MKEIEYFKCNLCGAVIGVKQDFDILRYPAVCHEEQGGCGRLSSFVLVEHPRDLLVDESLTYYNMCKKNIKTKLEIETKVCSKCKVEKPVTEFYKDKKNKDGLQSRCKNCGLDAMKEYHKKKKLNIKISDSTMPLVDSGIVDKKGVDSKIKRNWEKFHWYRHKNIKS